MTTQAPPESIQAEYSEVCANFRLLTDIRFRLLTFLPIGTAAGIALALFTAKAEADVAGAFIGIFGSVVTCALALYNLRNDQLYDELVFRAAQLERYMKVKEGAFAFRPRSWLSIGPIKVEHAKIWWIYLSSLAAWLFLCFHSLKIPPRDLICGWEPALIQGAVAVGLVSIIAVICAKCEKSARVRLKNAAKDAANALTEIPFPRASISEEAWREMANSESWSAILQNASKLGGRDWKKETDRKKITDRLYFYLQDARGYYWDRPGGDQPHGLNLKEAAQLLGLVTDMPPRWIYDVASGRRA